MSAAVWLGMIVSLLEGNQSEMVHGGRSVCDVVVCVLKSFNTCNVILKAVNYQLDVGYKF